MIWFDKLASKLMPADTPLEPQANPTLEPQIALAGKGLRPLQLASQPAPQEPIMSNFITSIEHGIAAAAHDIVIGSKATVNFLTKANALVQKDAPTIEAYTALIDPRAASIERIGAALIGQIVPQVSAIAGKVSDNVTSPTVELTAELIADLKSLGSSLAAEISMAKTSLATGVTAAPATPAKG